jgi:hypothetical protein
MALRGKFQRPQNRPATIEYTEKGLSKLCCKTQRNLESPLFQAFFSTYVPEKAFSVCIKDSVFIEPACGEGAFLTEILRRKLAVVKKRYGKSSFDYERYAVLAVSSIYGVDILADNAEVCRSNLFDIWNREYTENAKSQANDDCRKIVRFILKKNILCGDALTMLQADGSPIIFAEWSMVTDSCIKRRDYALDELLSINDIQINIFQIGWEFDEELKAYIPAPVREFPPTDYRSIDKYD